jgi:hypothetical protein
MHDDGDDDDDRAKLRKVLSIHGTEVYRIIVPIAVKLFQHTVPPALRPADLVVKNNSYVVSALSAREGSIDRTIQFLLMQPQNQITSS